jgi:hypothetical protein
MNTDERRFRSRIAHLISSGFICGLVLCSTGCTVFRGISEAINDEPRTQSRLLRSDRPDERREAVLFFADHEYGLKPPYTPLYRQMARNDADPLVRATAVRSLNRARDKEATPVFIAALADTSPIVRLEAAKALNRVADPAAAEPLLKIVANTDESKDVRIAATEAIQHYRRVDVGRTLVTLLNQRDFGIAWQARRSLRNMTGRDMNFDEGAWLQFITGPTKPLG